MELDDIQLKKRFSELAARAQSCGYAVYSDFLTLAQQEILIGTGSGFELYGGYKTAERRLARFGEDWGAPPPAVWLRISPVQQKFADKLTHRDFLGALVGLGLRREVLGDIIVYENCGWLYCLDTVSGFITDELKQVRHTTVMAEPVDAPPENSTVLPEKSSFVVSSERLDAVVAAVFDLSRAESQRYFERELVFVNSRAVKKLTREPQSGDIVSVRGCGRFIYEGIERETKKGRLRVSVRVFG